MSTGAAKAAYTIVMAINMKIRDAIFSAVFIEFTYYS
jgi:hypothetical protein